MLSQRVETKTKDIFLPFFEYNSIGWVVDFYQRGTCFKSDYTNLSYTISILNPADPYFFVEPLIDLVFMSG